MRQTIYLSYTENKRTWEAILALWWIVEKTPDKDKTAHAGFVDLEKAVDNVNWKKIFEILGKVRNKLKENRWQY